MLFNFMTNDSFKQLLRYEDRNSMRFSIETRTRFADDINLIEHVFKIPSIYKIYRGWSKYLLRQAMIGILREAIRWHRDKVGSVTPLEVWNLNLPNDFDSHVNSILKLKFHSLIKKL